MAKSILPGPQAEPIRVALGKIGHHAEVAIGKFSPEVHQHVYTYGLKQILNDAAASGKNDDEKVGLFNKKLEALYAGTIRAARESDPVAKEARRIASDYVARKTDHKPGTEEFKAAVSRAMGLPAIQALATQAVEAAKALDLDIEV